MISVVKTLLLVAILLSKVSETFQSIFYPFGPEVGDELLFYNDDGFEGPIAISVGFPYFNKKFYSIYVNTNGVISFDNGVSSYTPGPFPIPNGAYIIAPFWTDVDTRPNHGSVFYRESTDPDLLGRITKDVLTTYSSRGLYFFQATWAYIVTWENVTHYGGDTTTPVGSVTFTKVYYDSCLLVNSFQVVLLTDETYAFTMFNFGNISWTYGTAGDAIDGQVGFNAGDGVNYFVVPGSRTPEIGRVEETTNVGVKGRWLFRIDQAKIDAGECSSDGVCAFNEEQTENGCEMIAPALDDCPVLKGPTVVDRLYVYFYCQLSHNNTNSTEVVFEVTFLFNGEQADNVPIELTTKQSVPLHERYLHGNMGKWPSNYEMIVNEGDDLPAKVHMKSTIPITCFGILSGEHRKCYNEFSIVSSDDLLVYQKGREGETNFTCKYRLDETDWKPDENSAYNEEFQLEVLTVRGPLVEPPKIDTIRFGAGDIVFQKQDEDGNSYKHLWNGYSPPDVAVYRYDGTGATCVSSGDPRMTTFDKMYFDVFSPGQFVLVRSSSARNFEVHVRHKLCNRAVVACVCGIAVREGNDVLSLDMCESELSTLHRTASGDGKLAKGAKITSDGGTSHTILTPSGAYVNVDVYDWGMNVYVKVLVLDFRKTEGLCGMFDNNPNNDFKLQGSDTIIDRNNPEALDGFINSWRIPEGHSYFEKVPELSTSTNYTKRCICQSDFTLCDAPQIDQKQYDLLTPTAINIITNEILTLQELRQKRTTNLYTVDDNVDLDYDPSNFDFATNFSNNLHFDWPTATGITEVEAWYYCNMTLVESAVYQACVSTASDLGLEAVTFKCVEDVKVSGSYDWAEDKINEIRENCLDSILQMNTTTNNNLTSPAPDIVAQMVLTFVEEIVSSICPRQCNGRGQCLNSVCHCEEGYEGVDCSGDSSLLPSVKSLSNQGLCDIRLRLCNTVTARAQNIINTQDLFCRIEVVEADAVYYTNASYQGLYSLICPLPPAQILIAENNLLTYNISVTKNGLDYGPSKTMKVFDGNCIECTNVEDCSISNSSCSISGQCINSSVVHPKDTCYICDPIQNQNQWSLSPGPQCDTEVDYCSSSPCVNDGTCLDKLNGYECICSDAFSGNHCEVEVIYSDWEEWSDYGSCTRSCDYGLQTRHRECLLSETCSGISNETRLCNTHNCPELESEFDIGSDVFISGTNIEQLIYNKEAMFVILAEGLNDYCSGETTECCQILENAPNRIVPRPFDIFEREHLRTASGFPKEDGSDEIIMKIIVEISSPPMRAVCLNRAKRDSDNIYVPSYIIDQAVVLKGDRIQNELGLTISVRDYGPNEESTGLTTSQKTFVIVGVICGVIGIGFAVVFSVHFTQKRKATWTINPAPSRILYFGRDNSRSASNLSLGIKDRLPKPYHVPSTVDGRSGTLY